MTEICLENLAQTLPIHCNVRYIGHLLGFNTFDLWNCVILAQILYCTAFKRYPLLQKIFLINSNACYTLKTNN